MEVTRAPCPSDNARDVDLPSDSTGGVDQVAPPSHPQRNVVERPEALRALEDGYSDSVTEVGEQMPEDRIVAVAPSDVEVWKYYREQSYSSTEAKVETISALQEDFTRPETPKGWEEFVGPEGKPYFVRETKPFKFVTISNIQDEVRCQRVNAAVTKLHERLLEANLSGDIEVMVLCTYQGCEEVIGYYIVNWATKTVMWLEPVGHELVTKAERQPVSLPHLRLAVLSQFFLHVEIFCSHRPLPKALFKEVKAAYRSGVVDTITSDTSMFAYDSETCRQLAETFRNFDDGDEISADATWSAARLLKTLYSDRYLAYYGETGARCSRSDAALETENDKPRSLLFLMISAACFFMPSVFLKELELLFVDKTVHYHAWRRFITVAKQDWADSIVPALVLLAADVGLLIMQGIENRGVTRSVGQITGYTSAVLSLSVYFICQILTRRHRHGNTETADKALNYIRHAPFPCIAVAFSLPVALLLWSTIAFLASLMYTCLHRSNLATQITLGAVLGLIAVAMALLVFMEWQNDDKSPIQGFKLFAEECTRYLRSFRLFRRGRGAEQEVDAAQVKEDNDEEEADTQKKSPEDFGSSSSYSVDECVVAGTSNTAGRRRGWSLWRWGRGTDLERTSSRTSDRTMV